jgi:catechol 2,3-dioxygenase-like lactoylglutathione lyase family enzyme
MIRGMNHAGFVVKNLDEAVAFYEEVVGLVVQDRLERTGGPISQVVGYEEAHLRIAKMGARGEEHFLELIEYVTPPSGERATEERAVIGGAHVAWIVDDIHEAFDRVMANGAIKMNPPAEMVPGRWACYMQDPEGNWIEFIQQD